MQAAQDIRVIKNGWRHPDKIPFLPLFLNLNENCQILMTYIIRSRNKRTQRKKRKLYLRENLTNVYCSPTADI